MPIKMLPDGAVVFDTVDELLDFRRRSVVVPAAPRRASARPAKRVVKKAPAEPGRSRVAPRLNVSPASLSLMSAIRDVGKTDIVTEDFAGAISVRTTQLPQMFMQLTKELRSIDMRPEDVVIRSRVYNKGRAKSVYRAGPRIVEAIKRAEHANAPLFKGGM